MSGATKCNLPCDAMEGGNIHKYNDEEIEVLQFRFGFEVGYLCDNHYMDQFSRYNGWHKNKCSDPSNRHKKPAKTNLKLISLDLARQVKLFIEFLIIPGQWICRKCELFLIELIEEQRERDEGVQDDENGNLSDCSQPSLISSNASDCTLKAPFHHKLQIVNSILELLELTHITEKEAKNPQKVTEKVLEIGDEIYRILKLPAPSTSVGDKVLEQFVNEFDGMSAENQYQVLTSMPRGTSRVELQKTFKITHHKAQRS